MLEDVRLLLELQDLDYWIDELERSKEYIPDMMKSLREEMETVVQELEGARERLQQAQVEVRNIELKTADAKAQLERYQEQMLTIKTNKEYDALVTQIEATKTEVAADEEVYISTLDEIDELQKRIEELDEKNGAIRTDNQERLDSLQKEIDSVAGKVDEKVAHRRALKAKVPRRIMSVYQRVHKGRGGDVVVRLKRGACGACYKSLTPQKIQMVKLGQTVQTCDSCGRILISEGDE